MTAKEIAATTSTVVAVPSFLNPEAELDLTPEGRLQGVIGAVEVLRQVARQAIPDKYDLSAVEKKIDKLSGAMARCATRSDSRIDAYKRQLDG